MLFFFVSRGENFGFFHENEKPTPTFRKISCFLFCAADKNLFPFTPPRLVSPPPLCRAEMQHRRLASPTGVDAVTATFCP